MKLLFPLAALFSAALAAQTPAAMMTFESANGDQRSSAPAATEIELNVNAMLVEGTVRQRFRNDSEQFVEATWLQALPENAAVHNFEVRIGERRIQGEIKTRNDAQQTYQAARSSGQLTAIVDQDHANGFSTRVANVAPGEWVEVKLQYAQVLTYQDGLFKLKFPLAVHSKSAQIRAGICASVAESGPLACSANQRAVNISVHLNPGLAIKRIDSATHNIDVAYAGAAMEVALRSGPVADDRDFELIWEPEPLSAPSAALMTETRNGEHYALIMLVPPKQPLQPLARELILVIDTSGSMYGDALAQAKAAAQDALTRLQPTDRFNVIRFSDETSRLFEAPVAATRVDVDRALAFVDAMEAEGGTNMLDALALSLKGAPPAGFLRQVVFATDGEVEQEQALLRLIETDLRATRLFPIGIGQAPNGAFLRQAGELGRGAYLTVRDLNAVAAELANLFDKLDRPVLRDFTLDYPASAEVYPRQLPDLYHGEPLLITAKLGALSGEIAAHGLLASGKWEQSLKLNGDTQDAGIARLWARRKITALEDVLRRDGPSDGPKAAITMLGLTHHLVTPYTSLVAVEKIASRSAGEPLALARLDDDVIDLMPTASPQRLWLGAALLLTLLALSAQFLARGRVQ